MLGSTLVHLVLPALVVAAYPVGVIARIVRAQLLDTVGEAHVQMVRSLGFPERTVFGTFAMRLAWNPVTSVLALVFAYSLVTRSRWSPSRLFGARQLRGGVGATLDTPATPAHLRLPSFTWSPPGRTQQAALDPRIRPVDRDRRLPCGRIR
jgi:peptide/nickel transport system permease protein